MRNGGPAFPLHAGTMTDCEGLSLRDWFAGQAMVGSVSEDSGTLYREETARVAYAIADAMLKAREAPHASSS